MQITWNGLGSFSITAKPAQGDVTLVTDPFHDEGKMKLPRSLAASLVVVSHDQKESNNTTAVAGEGKSRPFIVDHPGEYEVQGAFVYGIRAPKKDGTEHTIYLISVEDIRIAFLGAIDRMLTDEEMKRLGTVDVLIVPVDGGNVLSNEQANELVASIEPRMVIPSYASDVEKFCQELACPRENAGKLKITKSSLPQDEIRVAVLSR